MAEKYFPLTKDELTRLTAEYPTPFYLYDEKLIRAHARRFLKAFSIFPGFREYFAVKACPNPYILKIFAENPNRPLSRDWLLETTSHRSRDPFDRAIDLRITRIRRKIEPTPEKPTVIRTVRGVGYMFVPPAE